MERFDSSAELTTDIAIDVDPELNSSRPTIAWPFTCADLCRRSNPPYFTMFTRSLLNSSLIPLSPVHIPWHFWFAISYRSLCVLTVARAASQPIPISLAFAPALHARSERALT